MGIQYQTGKEIEISGCSETKKKGGEEQGITKLTVIIDLCINMICKVRLKEKNIDWDISINLFALSLPPHPSFL